MVASNIFTQQETIAVLDCIGENIFVADTEFNLVWMNKMAHELINQIKEDVHVSSSDEVIGKNLSVFHRNFAYQEKILKESLPYTSRIQLFGKYSADLTVTELKNEHKDHIGYILIWNDVTEEEQANQETQKLIEELMTPILPMMVDDSLLVPLIGTYDEHRFDMLQRKLLHECSKADTEFVVFDFSGMSLADNQKLVTQIRTLTDTVSLIGAEPIHVGFPISMVKQFVQHGIKADAKTFRTFKKASTYLLKRKGYYIAPIENE